MATVSDSGELAAQLNDPSVSRIVLASGTYNVQGLTIDRDVELVGCPGATIIGDDRFATIQPGNDVSVSGIKFDGFLEVFQLADGDHGTIEVTENRFCNTENALGSRFTGQEFGGAELIRFAENRITDAKRYGIRLAPTGLATIEIENNIIDGIENDGTAVGINIDPPVTNSDASVLVRGNSISNIKSTSPTQQTVDGIIVQLVENPVIEQNTITNVDVPIGQRGHGIYARGTSNATIRNNTLTETASDGVLVKGGAMHEVVGNTIVGADEFGIRIDGIADSQISGNSVETGERQGLIAFASQDVGISNNSFVGNGDSFTSTPARGLIHFSDSTSMLFQDNIVQQDNFLRIVSFGSSSVSSSGTIKGNVLDNPSGPVAIWAEGSMSAVLNIESNDYSTTQLFGFSGANPNVNQQGNSPGV